MTAKRRLTDFIPDARNANRGTERGLRMLDDSLRKHGAGRSILVDKNNKVIAGNKTLERAVDIGLADAIVVPTDGRQLVVVQRTDIDLETKAGRELALADNRVGQVDLEWDGDTLAALANEGVDLSALWNDDELAALIGASDDPPGDPGAAIDRADELQQVWQVQRGDVWEAGAHRLACGDSTNADDVARVMRGERADAVVTDPPYDISQGGRHDTYGIDVGKANEFEDFDKGFVPTAFLNVLPSVCQEMTNYLIFTSTYLQWRYYLPHFFELNDVASFIVWTKPYATTNVRQVSFTHSFETAVYSWNKGHYFEALHGTDNYDVIDMTNNEGGRSYDHPTAKPLALIERMVRQLSPEGALVLDPFLGSGTTLVACERTGRRGRGVEIEPKYVAVALDRLQKMGLEPKRA